MRYQDNYLNVRVSETLKARIAAEAMRLGVRQSDLLRVIVAQALGAQAEGDTRRATEGEGVQCQSQ